MDDFEMVAFEPTDMVKIEERKGGIWKVVPGVADVRIGQTVTISAQESPSLLVFMIDARISGGVRRFFVPEGGQYDFEVSETERGVYPYVVVVQTADGPVLAEGSTLPIFRVDY